MSEVKMSSLLEKLVNRAKTVGDIPNPPFTAERFLVAVLDALAEEHDPFDTEYLALSVLIKTVFPDANAARTALLAHINAGKSASVLDDLYMKKKIQDAKQHAAKKGFDELAPSTLLASILNDPGAVIKALAAGHSESAAEETKQTAEPDEKPETEELFEKTPDSPLAKSEMKTLIADVKRIRTGLGGKIFGQENAINVFAAGYFQACMLSMIDKKRTRPRATFLFVGPPGVGKTFMAESAAKALGLPFMRFDMSEYSDKEANIEFCGSDKVYKNAKAGNVTSFVSEHPKCVLLFDEIEKAHICVIHLFLQMLDAGRLRDNFTDEEVSFSDALIIMTTNAGKQLYEESERTDLSGISRKVVIKALQKDVNPETGVPYFPSAICSRFASGNVVMFNHIGASDLRRIAKLEIRRHADNLEKETGITLQIDERVYTALLFSEGSAADARTVRSRAETFFNDELYELLRLIATDKVKTEIDSIEKIKVGLDLSHASAEICGLFAAEGQTNVLVFAGEETVSLCKAKNPSVVFHGVQKLADAVGCMKSHEMDFVLLDMKYGAPAGSLASLNIEDVESPARDFYKFLREQGQSLPVYLLETRGAVLSDEEQISFLRQGVRGVLRLTKAKDSFGAQLDAIASDLHQQASMETLAKENKLVSFETAQSVSKNGKNAEIKLYDFQTVVAVDSEDAKNVLSAVSKPNVHFEDVIGAREAKKELTYFVEYLKNPKKYMGTGVKAPKGIVLYGPPGTGKTMLAKAMACEAGVTFIAAEGNQFLKKYVGEGSEKVHELFKTARKYAPSILFIDEIDAIAKERKGGENSGAVEATLTAFLTEMDGFANDPSRPVFVLAATNFDVEPGSDKSLDPALMRRFDRRVYIDLPGKEDRIRFLKMKIARNPALDISEEQIDTIAMRSAGMSPAQLDSAVELALRSAIREGSTKVTDAILEDAFETFNGGEAKKWDISQLERVARHEAGHAFLCFDSGETPGYLTIVARGNHGGYMQHADREGKAIYTRDELLARIRTSLGGRAAEIAYYGERDGISTGASGDLVSATNMAKQIICTYGMDETFGLAVLNPSVADGVLSAEVIKAVNSILQTQLKEAVRILTENRGRVDALVNELMNKNHLTGAEIEKILCPAKQKEE